MAKFHHHLKTIQCPNNHVLLIYVSNVELISTIRWTHIFLICSYAFIYRLHCDSQCQCLSKITRLKDAPKFNYHKQSSSTFQLDYLVHLSRPYSSTSVHIFYTCWTRWCLEVTLICVLGWNFMSELNTEGMFVRFGWYITLYNPLVV